MADDDTGTMQPLRTLLKSRPSSPAPGDCGECPKCGIELEIVPEQGNGTWTLRAHRCCQCGDAGFVRYAVPVNDSRFGKAHPCPGCAEQETSAPSEEDFARRTRVPVRFAPCRIETWLPANGRPREKVLSYVESWPPPKPFLLLFGDKGQGKTHLACGAIRELWALHGKVGRFWPVVDLLDRYRATFDADRATESVEAIDAEMRRTDLLVLDDLGTQKSTEWAEERLFRLIDERSRELRPLVVTTNLSLLDLPPRVRSRLADVQYAITAQFAGADRRAS